MSEQTKRQVKNLINSVGKRGAQALFPNEFELYFTAFELVDSEDKVVQYFAFPLNPENITESEAHITTMKKTNAGITTMTTQTFNPVTINISGNFGRRLKFITRLQEQGLSLFSGTQYTEEFTARVGTLEFSSFLKTGYGCIKLLDTIIKQSKQLDKQSNPHTLYFYNLSLGNAYVVNINSSNYNQTMQSNMIWGYNLSMTAIAPMNQNRALDSKLASLTGMFSKETTNIANKNLSMVKTLIRTI
jgi:hypothetical protein